MIDTRADAVELDYKTDCSRAHAATRDRVTFIGNIDPSGILARGTESQVIEETATLLTLFADTPRFVLNAGCAIPRGTPPENLTALIRTAREFTLPGM
jgi:uroporphyrinogen-III decarboxylase